MEKFNLIISNGNAAPREGGVIFYVTEIPCLSRGVVDFT